MIQRGRNRSVGSVLGSLSCLMQCHGFDSPLRRILSSRGDFSLGVNMDSDIAWNSFKWENKLRTSLCTHVFHRTDPKDPDIHVLDGWMPATKTHPADFNVWNEKWSHTQKIPPKMVNPTDFSGEREEDMIQWFYIIYDIWFSSFISHDL